MWEESGLIWMWREFVGVVLHMCDSTGCACLGLSKMLQRTLKKQGMEFKMNTKVTGAVRTGSGSVQVSMETVKGGKEETQECDVLLVCVGRRPYTDSLGLQVGVVNVGGGVA